MLVPIEWLKDFVDIKASAQEIADACIMTGSNVESVEETGASIKNVVVGKILSIEKHPDSDHLVICSVDVAGEAPLQIVTGADNVFEGAVVPVALNGAELPNGMKIKPGKLRGVRSEGMLCSGEELCLTEADVPGASVNGILILNSGLTIGENIVSALKLSEAVIDFEITPNRSDCLSITGMAREVAATFNLPYIAHEFRAPKTEGNVHDFIAVQVDEPLLCPRYTAAVVKNIKIAPSPEWMQKRLIAAGVNAINNIVDITNYVMLEYGQPMHAFSLDRIDGGKIIVRRAKEGETLVTLDGVERHLSTDDLVIADEHKPVALAGVMGGENSKITDETVSIMFESAVFDSISVRKTGKKLGLSSESSMRFEKGVWKSSTMDGLQRALELVEEICGGEIMGGVIDVLDGDLKPKELTVSLSRINRLLGSAFTFEEAKHYLNRVYFEVEKIDEDQMRVKVPLFRLDIEGMADIAEEILRIHNYNSLPETLLKIGSAAAQPTMEQYIDRDVKNMLCGAGFHEIITWSFTGDSEYAKLGMETPKSVVISNPLGEDQKLMRTTLLGGMLSTLSLNASRGAESMSAFEFSRVFKPVENKKLPDEVKTLCLGMYGSGDFYDLKGIVEKILEIYGVEDKILFRKKTHPTYHPGKCAEIILAGKTIGLLGEINPIVAKRYDLEGPLCAELNTDALLAAANRVKQFQPLFRYPAIERDISLLVDQEVAVGEMMAVIKKAGGALLEKVQLTDVYQGAQIAQGKKSVTFSLQFRSKERTLKDDEVNTVFSKIIRKLEGAFSAQLRS